MIEVQQCLTLETLFFLETIYIYIYHNILAFKHIIISREPFKSFQILSASQKLPGKQVEGGTCFGYGRPNTQSAALPSVCITHGLQGRQTNPKWAPQKSIFEWFFSIPMGVYMIEGYIIIYISHVLRFHVMFWPLLMC